MRAFVWTMVILFGIDTVWRLIKLIADESDNTSDDAFFMALSGGMAVWGALVL